jgi:hypothetical protein
MSVVRVTLTLLLGRLVDAVQFGFALMFFLTGVLLIALGGRGKERL